MRALDLFCGSGGASMGLNWAGFDVTGIDWERSQYYPFDFKLQRVENLTPEDLQGYDLIWASPPCQHYSNANRVWENQHLHPDLIPMTRALLDSAKVPYIIENVPHAPLRADLMLCGSMFKLRLVRHRIFELSGFKASQPYHYSGMHHWKYVTVTGTPGNKSSRQGVTGYGRIEDWREAMGIDWMPSRAMSQAVPPIYAWYIAEEFLQCRASKTS
jgi:DNA (cytosine-5)-methyltransferase 1